jgi:L-ribulose-5-phosphate 3-epimerase|tara:strand:- start:4592 stop:5503 length:912 start_codon:yes stop_codon:yes gene_type:complete
LKRREFIKTSASLSAGMILTGLASTLINGCNKQMPFKISLAEWSLHRTLNNKEIDHLDLAAIAENNFGIKAIEYVNSFFFNHAKDKAYLTEMKNRADDHGVKSLLIMCDNEGNLGDPDDTKRTDSIENHYKWAEAAKFLDCHSIRVNARSFGSYDEQIRLAADGLQRLVEFGDNIGINIIVENHGGLSSNGEWLSSVMKKVNHPRIGTLPDFGNFRIENEDWYDRYKGMKELMPFAKAVSAKSHEFDEDGDETGSDYYRIMDIVLENGYNGYVGIEYEGTKHSEMEGIRLTNNLLKKIQNSIS